MPHFIRLFGTGGVVMAAGLMAAGCAWIGRVSVDVDGGSPDGCSVCSGTFGTISGGGRYVTFSSVASDLVPGDGNGTDDVFWRDVLTGTTRRASVDTGGGDPNGNSNDSSVSGDGRHVVFVSAASDLVPSDGNGANDVFVRDMEAGTTTRVSVTTSGGDANFGGVFPSISGDGRYVAFSSISGDLVPGDRPGTGDVFRRDVLAGTTTWVSVNTSGGNASGHSGGFTAISPDGRYVAFESAASDLVSGDNNGIGDVFVRDVLAGTTTRVSVDIGGGDPNTESGRPSISGDGRYLAFSSFASDLVPGDGNSTRDVFLRDVQAGTTTRVSVDAGGGDSNAYSDSPSVSGDGRYVAFESAASDLVSGDGNGTVDVFVRDRVRGTTIRLSQDLFHSPANGPSVAPRISGDGRYVAFLSDATNLGGIDTNGTRDVFIKYARVVTVSGISPNNVARGSTKKVTITGTGFEPGSIVDIPRPTDGEGTIVIRHVRVVSDTKITAVVSVPDDAPVGEWDVRVRHPATVLGAARVAAGQCSDCLQVVNP
jgi:Tol biopolymer transport system component